MPFVNLKKPDEYSLFEEDIAFYERKMREAETAPSKGVMKSALLKEISQINFERTRHFHSLFLQKKVGKEFLEYLAYKGMLDGNLMKLWSKPGFSNLCCLLCLAGSDGKAACICRVPGRHGEAEECVGCGCRGCSKTVLVSSS